MSNIVLNANSTSLILNGYGITDLVDGDTLTLTPVNPLSSHTYSLDGVNFQKRSDAYVYDLVFRVAKYSDNDEYMLAQINNPSLVIFDGSCRENFIKDGEERVRTFTLSSGSITTQPTETRNNLDGNNLREYTIRFKVALGA